MSFLSRRDRSPRVTCLMTPLPARWGMALLAAVGLAPALAATSPVQGFTSESWTQLVTTQRPAAVVFSTTDCAYCPAAIATVAKSLRASRPKAKLIVVVMDGEGQEATLRTDAHYRHADQLYVFQGNPMALRHAVDPSWRGMTPYVALISPQGVTSFHIGAPKQDVLTAALAGRPVTSAVTSPQAEGPGHHTH